MMRTQGQPTVQGYNAQAAVTREQIIVAAEIAVESPDFGHFGPAVRAALRELEDAGVTQHPETVLADAGYWHTRQMENILSDGIQVLVPPDAGLREGARPSASKEARIDQPTQEPHLIWRDVCQVGRRDPAHLQAFCGVREDGASGWRGSHRRDSWLATAVSANSPSSSML